ncbi:hypothetical protein [Tenacibaculum sp. nBUS_03]
MRYEEAISLIRVNNYILSMRWTDYFTPLHYVRSDVSHHCEGGND